MTGRRSANDRGESTGGLPTGRRPSLKILTVITAAAVAAALPVAWLSVRDRPATVTPAAATASEPARETREARLWTEAPYDAESHDDRWPLELGTRFTAASSGSVLGVRFYKPESRKARRGGHTGSLWDANGRRLARVAFTGGSESGWQEARFARPVPIRAGRVYTVSYHSPDGSYVASRGFAPVRSGPLATAGERPAVFQYGRSGFPRRANPRGYNYWVDLVFRWYGPAMPAPSPPGTPTGTPVPDPTPTVTVTVTETVDPPGQTPTPTPTATASTEPSVPPAPTPSVTRSETAEPPPGANRCAGHPTPECTGVRAGAKLRAMPLNIDGDAYKVTQPGTVLDGVHVPGTLLIHADNVTIRNSRIDGGVTNADGDRTFSFTISDSTVGPEKGCMTLPAIGQDKYKATRVHVRGHGDGFRASGDDIEIRDSYIYLCSSPGDHSDGIQTYNTGSHLVFHHNTVDQRDARHATAPIFLVDDNQQDVVVTDNLVMGGTYSIQVRNVSGRQVVRGNKLVDKSWIFGPAEANCDKVDWRDNTLVTIDDDYRVTSTVGPLPCMDY